MSFVKHVGPPFQGPLPEMRVTTRTARLHFYFSVISLFVAQPRLSGQIKCPDGCRPGQWSKSASGIASKSVKSVEQDRDLRIYSRGGRMCVRVMNEKWWIESERRKLLPPSKFSSIEYPAELGWADDNKTLYITQSVGFSTGYRTTVYWVEHGHVRVALDPTRLIIKTFNLRHQCKYLVDGADAGSDPNIAGLLWMNGGKELLIIAEVPPVGICKDMQYFGGFLVSVPSGQISERYSPQQLADRWGDVLGERLQSNLKYLSDDAKTRRP